MDFPAVYLPLPMEAVPLSTPRHSVAVCTTRLPLSPHCNPFSAHAIRQPRCFPPQSVHFFSLFCRSGFKEQRAACCSGRRLSGLTSHPPHPRKAGYVCTQRYAPERERCTALQVHNLFRTQAEIPRGSTSVHKNRSPRKQGRVDHAIGNRPESASTHGALPPSTHPKLGVSSRHQRFHRYALQRIFRPSLGNGGSD